MRYVITMAETMSCIFFFYHFVLSVVFSTPFLHGLGNLITILLRESSYQNHLSNRKILTLVWVLLSSSLVIGKHWCGSEIYCKQWRKFTVFMQVFQSATDVHKRSYDHFSCEALLQFMVYCQYEKVIKTDFIAENYKTVVVLDQVG
jgi:hypothetical protein